MNDPYAHCVGRLESLIESLRLDLEYRKDELPERVVLFLQRSGEAVGELDAKLQEREHG